MNLSTLKSLQSRIREDSDDVNAEPSVRPKRTRTNLSGYTPEQRRQHVLMKQRIWRDANRESLRARDRENFAKNREKLLARQAKYKQRTLSERRAYDIEYYRITRSDWHKDIQHKVSGARRRADKLGVPFSLDASWVSATVERLRIDPRCVATGIEMAPGRGWDRSGPFPNSPSIDRIEPSRGYVPDNVRVVCHFVNYAKRDFENAWVENAILVWAKRIADDRAALIAEEEAKQKDVVTP